TVRIARDEVRRRPIERDVTTVARNRGSRAAERRHAMPEITVRGAQARPGEIVAARALTSADQTIVGRDAGAGAGIVNAELEFTDTRAVSLGGAGASIRADAGARRTRRFLAVRRLTHAYGRACAPIVNEDVDGPIRVTRHEIGGEAHEDYETTIRRNRRLDRNSIPFDPIRSDTDELGDPRETVTHEDVDCPVRAAGNEVVCDTGERNEPAIRGRRSPERLPVRISSGGRNAQALGDSSPPVVHED